MKTTPPTRARANTVFVVTAASSADIIGRAKIRLSPSKTSPGQWCHADAINQMPFWEPNSDNILTHVIVDIDTITPEVETRLQTLAHHGCAPTYTVHTRQNSDGTPQRIQLAWRIPTVHGSDPHMASYWTSIHTRLTHYLHADTAHNPRGKARNPHYTRADSWKTGPETTLNTLYQALNTIGEDTKPTTTFRAHHNTTIHLDHNGRALHGSRNHHLFQTVAAAGRHAARHGHDIHAAATTAAHHHNHHSLTDPLPQHEVASIIRSVTRWCTHTYNTTGRSARAAHNGAIGGSRNTPAQQAARATNLTAHHHKAAALHQHIRELHQQGHNTRTIAELVGRHQRTIQRVLATTQATQQPNPHPRHKPDSTHVSPPSGSEDTTTPDTLFPTPHSPKTHTPWQAAGPWRREHQSPHHHEQPERVKTGGVNCSSGSLRTSINRTARITPTRSDHDRDQR